MDVVTFVFEYSGLGLREVVCILGGRFKMKTSRFLNDEELLKRAAEVLNEELGPVEACRFWALAMPKDGSEKKLDTVQAHREWQESLDQESFFDEVFPSES